MKFKDLKVWIFIFGMILLVGAYLYQHSKTNQDQLKVQGIKAIYLAKNNFVEAFYNYHDQLDGYLIRNFFKLADDDKSDAAARLVSRIDTKPKFWIEKIQPRVETNQIAPSFKNAEISQVKRDSSFLLQIKGYQFSLYDSPVQRNISPEEGTAILNRLTQEWELEQQEEGSFSGQFEIDHLVPIYQLMENNIQSQFFDDLYVLDENGMVVYPQHSSGFELLAMDSLTSFGESRLSLTLSEIDYEGFLSPALFGDKTLYLLGIKEKAQFQRVAYRINFTLLSVFFTVVLLVFVSIPIISIFSLREGDVLTKNRVFELALSLIVVMVVIGFSSFSLLQNTRSMVPARGDIENLKHIFKREIEALKGTLDQYEGHLDQDETILNEELKKKNVNELLTFNEEGHIISLALPDTTEHLDPIDFSSFPFISISGRDYVKDLAEKVNSYYISAHFSKSTGNLEGVISKRKEGYGKAITFRLDQMAPAISPNQRYFVFKTDGKILLKSNKVNIPINRLEDGVGHDKWKVIQTLIENNSGVKASRIWEIPLYVNGYEYQALLSRISGTRVDQEIWILYLEDKNLQHALHSLASLEAIAVFLPYLLVLVVLAIFIKMVKKPSIYLAFEPFSFHWYSPSPKKRERFLWLNYILAFDILLYFIVYLYIPLCIFKIFLWAGLFATQAGTCNFMMLYSKGTGYFKGNINGFIIVVFFLWTFFSGILILFSVASMSDHHLYLSILILSLMLGLKLLCFHLSSEKRMPSIMPAFIATNTLLNKWHKSLTLFWTNLTQVQVDKRIYALNFLLWLMIIGFLPGYFIHRQIFNQEKFIWEKTNHNETLIEDSNFPESELYYKLVLSLEKFRRTNFGLFTNQDDEKIKDFIAPNHDLFLASFSLPPNIENFGRVDGEGNYSLLAWLSSNGVFGILVLLILIGLFNMIMRLSNKIYLIDYHFTNDNNFSPVMERQHKCHFIIGLDAAKSRSWIFKNFDFTASELLSVSAIGNEVTMAPLTPLHKAVILENVHCLKEVETLLKTMLAFKEKYENEEILLFVASGRSLPELLDRNVPKADRLIITEMFSEFLFQFVPLDYQKADISLPYLGKEWQSMDSVDQNLYKEKMESVLFNDKKIAELKDELSYGPNVLPLARLISQEVEKDPLDKPLSQERFEKCLLSLQRFNKAYYMNIWAELSARERKMVYNYAKEGFINFFNKETMTALIQKGVLKMNENRDELVLFSKSFRNFVCIFISDEEVSRFRLDERKSGNAKMIQAAALSFVFISIALVSYFDPNILNETAAYFSAFLGVAGTVYSLLIKGLGQEKVLET